MSVSVGDFNQEVERVYKVERYSLSPRWRGSVTRDKQNEKKHRSQTCASGG